MGAIEEGGKVASGVVDSLKSQPLALALVVINVLFLAVGGYVMHDIGGISGASGIRKDALLAELAKNCVMIAPKSETDK